MIKVISFTFLFEKVGEKGRERKGERERERERKGEREREREKYNVTRVLIRSKNGNIILL